MFFSPRIWDTLRRPIRWRSQHRLLFAVPALGHQLFRPGRQELLVDLVDVHPARTALAGDVSSRDEVGEIALCRRSTAAGMQRKRANRREAAAGMISEADEALHCPAQPRLQRAI
jgi:hypothetical protein